MGPCGCCVPSRSSSSPCPARRLRRGRHRVPPGRRGPGRRRDHHHPARRPGDRRLLQRPREGHKGRAAAERPATPLRYFTHQFATELVGARSPSSSPRSTKSSRAGVQTTSPSWSRSSRPERRPEGRGPRGRRRPGLRRRRAHPDRRDRAGEAGHDDAAAEDQYAEGQKVLDAWVADHDVEINPKYAIELGNAGPGRHRPVLRARQDREGGLAAPSPTRPTRTPLPDHLVCLD